MSQGLKIWGESCNLADQLTLLKPWGADYARHTTASPPPRIQNAIYTSAYSTIVIRIIPSMPLDLTLT